MAFAEPEYQGVKEKRKKKGETAKKKKIPFIVPSPPPPPPLLWYWYSELFHILHTDTQVTFFMDSPSGN